MTFLINLVEVGYQVQHIEYRSSHLICRKLSCVEFKPNHNHEANPTQSILIY